MAPDMIASVQTTTVRARALSSPSLAATGTGTLNLFYEAITTSSSLSQPTHILSITFNESPTPCLIPIYGLSWACQSPLLAGTSRALPIDPQPDALDGVLLPAIAIDLPSFEGFWIVHEWVYLALGPTVFRRIFGTAEGEHEARGRPTIPRPRTKSVGREGWRDSGRGEGDLGEDGDRDEEGEEEESGEPPGEEEWAERLEVLRQVRETVIALQIWSDELWHIMEYTWEELVTRIGECREEVRGEGGGGGLGSVVGVEDD